MEGTEFDEEAFFAAIARRHVRDLSERRLSSDEVRAALEVPLGDEERREILSLIDWFCRHYPTPAERLAYARRAYRRWAAGAAELGTNGR